MWPLDSSFCLTDFKKLTILADKSIGNQESTTQEINMQNFRSLWPLLLEIIESNLKRFLSQVLYLRGNHYFLQNEDIYSYDLDVEN